jgi:hypothetical protein
VPFAPLRGSAPAQTCSSTSGWLRGGLALQVVGRGVAWLIDRQISAARKLNRGEPAPAFVTDRVGDRDAPGAQVRQRLLEVVAQQVELVLPQPVSGVYGDLGGRQLEDQPATADVNPGKSEHVADEDPIGLRGGAVEDDMCSVDQVAPRSCEATKKRTKKSRSRMSISHSPHEWLVRCAHGRVHPGMAWTGSQEVRTPPHGYRAEWCRHAEQGASRWSMPNNAAALMRGPSFLVAGLPGSLGQARYNARNSRNQQVAVRNVGCVRQATGSPRAPCRKSRTLATSSRAGGVVREQVLV